MTNKLAHCGVITLLIIFNVFLFDTLRRARKEVKQLEAERERLMQKESKIIEDIAKRNKEIGEKNEKIKYYIQILEEQSDGCLSMPVGAGVRGLLQGAGI